MLSQLVRTSEQLARVVDNVRDALNDIPTRADAGDTVWLLRQPSERDATIRSNISVLSPKSTTASAFTVSIWHGT